MRHTKLTPDRSNRLLLRDHEAQYRAAIRLRNDFEHRFHTKSLAGVMATSSVKNVGLMGQSLAGFAASTICLACLYRSSTHLWWVADCFVAASLAAIVLLISDRARSTARVISSGLLPALKSSKTDLQSRRGFPL